MRNKQFKCGQCDLTFLWPESLRYHEKAKHPPLELKTLQCEQCPYSTKIDQNLRKHILMMHTSQKFPCDLCGTEFDAKQYLLRHIKRSHAENNKLFKCEECSFITTQNRNLNRHLKKHKRQESECSICHKKVLHLHEHIKLFHKAEKKYECDTCPFTCKALSTLKYHISTHNKKEKEMFPCKICNKKLSSSCYLKEHIKRMHENKERLRCDDCESTFANKQSLMSHISKVHLGIRYNCDICEHKSTTKNALKTHKLIHLPDDQKLNCEICLYKTHSKSALWGHVRRCKLRNNK